MNLKEMIFGGEVADKSVFAHRESVQEWLPIKSIIGGTVLTMDNRFIKVLEVLPVNFYLKSQSDRQSIIFYFASYLKIAPERLQIRVITQQANIGDYVNRMKEHQEKEDNADCRKMIQDNIDEVSYLADNGAITRRFFLIFQYEHAMKARANTAEAIADKLREQAHTAIRYLDQCGLEVLEPEYEDNALIELLHEMICKKSSRNIKLPSGVFDMMTEIHGVYE